MLPRHILSIVCIEMPTSQTTLFGLHAKCNSLALGLESHTQSNTNGWRARAEPTRSSCALDEWVSEEPGEWCVIQAWEVADILWGPRWAFYLYRVWGAAWEAWLTQMTRFQCPAQQSPLSWRALGCQMSCRNDSDHDRDRRPATDQFHP